MSVQEQVARLEALLSRVQRNALLLREERGHREVVSRADVGSADAPRDVDLPTGLNASSEVPKRLSQPAESRYESEVKTLPPAAPSTPTQAPVSLEIAAADLESIPPYEGSHEETKPLWVGIQPPPAPSAPPASSKQPSPDSITATYDTSVLGVAGVRNAGGVARSEPPRAEPLESMEGLEPLETLESSPPLSGERPSSRTPSVTSGFDLPPSLEEPLNSVPAGEQTRLSVSPSEFGASPDFDEDRDGPVSDAPASALGATISLPEEDGAAAMELELAEPPPSSMRLVTPAPPQDGGPEEALEADLPRTSYRAAYDASLSAPPHARDELAAHDQGVRDRASSNPVPYGATPETGVSQRPIASQRPASHGPGQDQDLPPVLSSPPQAASSMRPEREGAPTSAAEVQHAAGAYVRFAPPLGAQSPEFVGEYQKPELLSFAALLDSSLSIDVSE